MGGLVWDMCVLVGVFAIFFFFTFGLEGLGWVGLEWRRGLERGG